MLTPGDIFKKRRLQLRKTLNTVSQETKVQEKYIEALENNEYTSFNSPVVASGFVKIYADYLGLDVEKMSAIYRRSYTQENAKNQHIKKKFDIKQFAKRYINPISITTLIVLVLISGLLIYFNRQIKEVDITPKIEISTPQDNITVNQSKVQIEGYTNKGNKVIINNNEVTNNNGNFASEITLKEGNNTIQIDSINQTKPDLRTTKTINITYQKQQTVTNSNTSTNTTDQTLYLDILSEPAWITLKVDDKIVLNQLVQVGKTKKFKVTKSFEISTGKPATTKVYVNNTIKELKIDSATHLASLSCTVTDNQLTCK